MREKELYNYLVKNFPYENEKCEWKEFKSLKHCIAGQQGEDVISYVSAIANMEGGHLVVGIKDGTLEIVGIQDFHTYTVQSIKLKILTECTNLNTEGLEIQELITTDTRKVVWIIHIPKHLYRLPVYAHKKCWQRIGDSLVLLTPSRLEAILNEVREITDWSAGIIPEATLQDLDTEAIQKARHEFVKRNPKYSKEVATWNDEKFLDKAKLTIKGNITRAALILLGKEEVEHYLGSTVKMRWNLKTMKNEDKDFEVFSIPFLRSTERLYLKIRNLKYRYLREHSLYPEEFLRYDPFSIREPLHNAIAHQDYTKGAYINVTEYEDDHLVYTNAGSFLPASVENVVLKDTPEETYRNPFLVAAMQNLDMIETQGGGIRKIFNLQRKRFFPLPDYDLSNNKVKVTITGKILNEEFARILTKNPDLGLIDILLLDKIQKQLPITTEQYTYLKKEKFIEGRKATPYLSYKVIEPTQNDHLIVHYVNNKSFDDKYFKDLIIQYIKKKQIVKRSDIDLLIIPKLSAVLSDTQKKAKVGNLLSALRMEGKIKTVGYGMWTIQ